MTGVNVDDVADELYGLPPDQFTAARDDAVRRASDAQTKAALKTLRKPTVAAHLVNRIVRDRGDDVDALIALGDDLRAAMGRDAADVRRLTQERRDAIAALVPSDVPAAAQADVTATLEAATADPDLAAAVRSGRLVKPLRYAGFGALPDLGDALAARPKPAKRAKPGKPGKPAQPAKPAKPAAKRPARPATHEADLAALRDRVLDLAGAADDAQRRYELAVRAADEAREALAVAERERAAAHKTARAAHAEAEKSRRELGRLERS
jgi:hypothetical protein